LAGLIGAAMLTCITAYAYHFSWQIILFITIAGFLGMLSDSVLGSWLQIQYKTTEGILTDDAAPGAEKIKGFSWCTNDMVNILTNLLITLLFFYIYRQIN